MKAQIMKWFGYVKGQVEDLHAQKSAERRKGRVGLGWIDDVAASFMIRKLGRVADRED